MIAAHCRRGLFQQGRPTPPPCCNRRATNVLAAGACTAAGSSLLGWVTPAALMQGVGGTIAFFGVPYLVILLLLVTQQRALIFPRPSQVASARDHHGGQLVTVPTPVDLPAGAGEVGTSMAALFFPPPAADGLVVVYFHGNADQIGWGGAYVGALLREHKVRPRPSLVCLPCLSNLTRLP